MAMPPGSSSSGRWRDMRHPDDDRMCLPSPVDAICGWNIVLVVVLAIFALALTIRSRMPRRPEEEPAEEKEEVVVKEKTVRKKSKSRKED